MRTQQSFTVTAKARGWSATQHPTASHVTVFVNGEHVFHVGFFASNGRIASAQHFTPDGQVIRIPKGKDWAGRIQHAMAVAANDERDDR